MVNLINIKGAINPIDTIKVKNDKILMDRIVLPNRTVTEEQKLNIKPLFS